MSNKLLGLSLSMVGAIACRSNAVSSKPEPGTGATTASEIASAASSAPAEGSPASSVSALPTAEPSGSTAVASASTTLTGFAALSAKYPPSEPWPTGKGTQCGEAICGADQFCCSTYDQDFCVPAGQYDACYARNGSAAACDESADCPGSQLCCHGRVLDNDFLAECVTPKRCAQFWDPPGRYMIPAREICARGGTCKDPRLVCIEDEVNSPSGGQCVHRAARVRCGTSADCPADTPWCFWDADAAKGECIARGPWYHEDGVYECDEASDCPGESCCGSGRNSFCGTAECEPELAYGVTVCRQDKDCPIFRGKRMACEPDDRAPPGVGLCGQR